MANAGDDCVLAKASKFQRSCRYEGLKQVCRVVLCCVGLWSEKVTLYS